MFGGYSLINSLSCNGVAEVFEARRNENKIALKIIHQNHSSLSVVRKRFIREGKIYDELRNPAIVRVLERGEYNGRLFLAMEFVEGVTMAEKINSGFDLLGEILLFCLDVADAVKSVHLAGIVHRAPTAPVDGERLVGTLEGADQSIALANHCQPQPAPRVLEKVDIPRCDHVGVEMHAGGRLIGIEAMRPDNDKL